VCFFPRAIQGSSRPSFSHRNWYKRHRAFLKTVVYVFINATFDTMSPSRKFGHEADPGDCQEFVPDTFGDRAAAMAALGVCWFAPYALQA
jgi:hypothetical protein